MATIMRVRATLNYGAGGPGVGTFYFTGSVATPVTADATDVVGRVRAFYAALAAQLGTNMSVSVQGSVDTLEDSTGVLNGGLVVTPPAILAGTGIAPYLPVTNCLVVRLTTNTIVGTRRLEGRSYVGPLSGAAASSGLVPTTAAGTAANTAVNALLTGATASFAVVWHRPKGFVGGQIGQISGGSAWSQFGSLRSRRD